MYQYVSPQKNNDPAMRIRFSHEVGGRMDTYTRGTKLISTHSMMLRLADARVRATDRRALARTLGADLAGGLIRAEVAGGARVREGLIHREVRDEVDLLAEQARILSICACVSLPVTCLDEDGCHAIVRGPIIGFRAGSCAAVCVTPGWMQIRVTRLAVGNAIRIGQPIAGWSGKCVIEQTANGLDVAANGRVVVVNECGGHCCNSVPYVEATAAVVCSVAVHLA